MTEVTGKLWVTCNSYRTVDENDLPIPDKYTDGLKDFEVTQLCCETAKKFHDEYNREFHFAMYVYPDLLDKPKDQVKMMLRVISGEYDDASDIQVEKCPWCQCLPTLQIVKNINRIKKCEEKIIPAETKQICSVSEVEE
ncbi:hypothetical protein [Nitrosopumilus sp.]|uniref:hypothetical protein n=1 Tax=Nitrosopumilus sp. TaxID=2024843 RepID=UPI003D0DD6B2